MTPAIEELLQRALELPEEDRERIADALWRSIDGDTLEEVEEAWKVELERRVAEIDEGKVRLVSGGEVMAGLRARFVDLTARTTIN